MEKQIYLGAGCFWGVQAILQRIDGILETEVGYIGGQTDAPTYKEVCTGNTGHAEVVRVKYDTNILTTESVLDLFLRLHDPTQVNRQGVDIGTQYRSEIFFTDDEQKLTSQKILEQFNLKNSFGKPAATLVTEATQFWSGEDYHQNYFDKNPGHLCHTLREVW